LQFYNKLDFEVESKNLVIVWILVDCIQSDYFEVFWVKFCHINIKLEILSLENLRLHVESLQLAIAGAIAKMPTSWPI